jgi:hypothetical protein
MLHIELTWTFLVVDLDDYCLRCLLLVEPRCMQKKGPNYVTKSKYLVIVWEYNRLMVSLKSICFEFVT